MATSKVSINLGNCQIFERIINEYSFLLNLWYSNMQYFNHWFEFNKY